MSRAEELAEEMLRLADLSDAGRGPAKSDPRRQAAAELRRLAALEKAIMDAVPVFWYRPVMDGDMYEGPHHNNSFVGRLQRAEKPGEWLPLYTLNGIKKP